MVRKFHPKSSKCKSNNTKKLFSNSKFKWLIQTTLMHNKWCKWIPTNSQICSKWQKNKSNRCKWCNNSRCSNSRFSLTVWETKLTSVICLLNSNNNTNSIFTSNSSNNSMLSKWWLQVTTIRINLLIKMVCLSVQSNISRSCSNSSNMDRNKLTMVKKLCRTQINSNICKNRGRKRIQFKRKFKRSSKSVLIMMHFLVILNSQLVMHLFITILKAHLSMLKTCQL